MVAMSREDDILFPLEVSFGSIKQIRFRSGTNGQEEPLKKKKKKKSMTKKNQPSPDGILQFAEKAYP